MACRRTCFSLHSGNCKPLDKALLSSVTNILCISVLCQYAPSTDNSERASVAILLAFASLESVFVSFET